MEKCTPLVQRREDSPNLGAPQKLMHSETTFRITGETVIWQLVPDVGPVGPMAPTRVSMVGGVEVVAGANMVVDTMVVEVMVESPSEVVSLGEENKDDAVAIFSV